MDYKFRFYSPTLGRFILPDNVSPDLANPQTFNKYSYVNNRPINFNDPTGHWFETVLDIGFIAYDIYDISQNGLNWTNGLALAADVACAVLPIATGGGAVVRAVSRADDAVDVVKGTSKLLDDAAELLADGVKNADSPLVVLGTDLDNYKKIADGWTATFLNVADEKYDRFIKNYGKEAFWEYVNKPFVQKEIIDKGKNIIITTPLEVVKNILPKKSNTFRELEMLLGSEKYIPLGQNALKFMD